MRMLILKTSPRRNSNSSNLAEAAAQAAREAGADVEVIDTAYLRIHPCDACDVCLSGADCIHEDDMQTLIPRLLAADAILLATPVYWMGISAQLKLIIDRLYQPSNQDGDAFAGKVFGLILAYADSTLQESGGILALATIERIVSYLRGEMAGCVHASAADPGDVLDQPARLEEAAQLGRIMARWAQRKEALPLRADG